MAGYDFSFHVPARYREYARQWLRYFQRSADMIDLEVRYRTCKVGRGRIEVYVTVDGPLPLMQHLGRQLYVGVVHFLRVTGKTMATEKTLHPFLAANSAALKGITDTVFEVTRNLGGRPAELAISSKLAAKAAARTGDPRVRRAIHTIIVALNG